MGPIVQDLYRVYIRILEYHCPEARLASVLQELR